MIDHLPRWIGSAVGIAGALSITSCSYDPGYYSSASSSYRSGGVSPSTYSSSPFRTSASVFISTGNPRWGYDPGCHSYYDYTTRRYYDPYLMGYYPLGYRPSVVIGVPHPHGWQRGRSTCPPPSRVRNIRLQNYQHRGVAYRRLNHSWAKHIGSQSNDRHQRASRTRSIDSSHQQPSYRNQTRTRSIQPSTTQRRQDNRAGRMEQARGHNNHAARQAVIQDPASHALQQRRATRQGRADDHNRQSQRSQYRRADSASESNQSSRTRHGNSTPRLAPSRTAVTPTPIRERDPSRSHRRDSTPPPRREAASNAQTGHQSARLREGRPQASPKASPPVIEKPSAPIVRQTNKRRRER